MGRKFSDKAASVLLGAGIVHYGDGEPASKRGLGFMRRDAKVEIISSGPVLSGLNRDKCPRCSGRMATTKLAKKGPSLPWCKKCRVVLPKE